MELEYNPYTTKRCLVCGKLVPLDEAYCACGFAFDSNRCTGCGRPCNDYTAFCYYCGSETQNYLDGLI